MGWRESALTAKNAKTENKILLSFRLQGEIFPAILSPRRRISRFSRNDKWTADKSCKGDLRTPLLCSAA
jgi:hypothetical protein